MTNFVVTSLVKVSYGSIFCTISGYLPLKALSCRLDPFCSVSVPDFITECMTSTATLVARELISDHVNLVYGKGGMFEDASHNS